MLTHEPKHLLRVDNFPSNTDFHFMQGGSHFERVKRREFIAERPHRVLN
jgi:hypothetical protein